MDEDAIRSDEEAGPEEEAAQVQEATEEDSDMEVCPEESAMEVC